MLKKLTKLVTNNFGLKIIALLFAFALWLVVVNIDDPTQTQNFTASINIENADYMTQQGQYFEAKDSNMTVTFKVSAKRSVMRNLSNTDFRATADMENIEEVDGVYRVPLDITATRYAGSINFEGKTRYMEVTVENLVTEQFPIQTTVVGDPAEGYAVGELKVSPNILKVTGPESVVGQIDRAVASVDVTGASSDLTDSVNPVVLDAQGNSVDTSKLSFNIDKVAVSVVMLDVRNLTIEVTPYGQVADGYEYTGVDINPTRIAVKGKASTLNAAGPIEIPEEILDITGAQSDVVVSVDISEYLPEGLELVDPSANMIELTAKVEQIVAETFTIPGENIVIQNVRNGYVASIEDTEVTVTLKGLRRNLDALQGGNIHGSVNLNGLGEGRQSVELTLDLDQETYRQDGTVTVMVLIERDEETGENVPASGGNGTGTTGTTGGSTTGGSTSGGGATGGSTGGNQGNSEAD